MKDCEKHKKWCQNALTLGSNIYKFDPETGYFLILILDLYAVDFQNCFHFEKISVIRETMMLGKTRLFFILSQKLNKNA